MSELQRLEHLWRHKAISRSSGRSDYSDWLWLYVTYWRLPSSRTLKQSGLAMQTVRELSNMNLLPLYSHICLVDS